MSNRDQELSAAQQQRFDRFLFWMTPIIFGFCGLYVIASIVAYSIVIVLMALILFGYGVCVLVSRWLVRRNQLVAAVNLQAVSALISVILITLVAPEVYPLMILGPILVVGLVLQYTRGHSLRAVMAISWATTVAAAVLGELVQIFPPLPGLLGGPARILRIASISALVFLLLAQTSTYLYQMISHLDQANSSLRDSQASLEEQVAARTAALEEALRTVQDQMAVQQRLQSENVQQRRAILELSVPVLPITAHTLIIPLVGAMDSTRLEQLRNEALNAITQRHTRQLLLDVTGVPIVDTQIAAGLIEVVRAARLLGSQVTLLGIRPEVAQSLVGLGISFAEIQTEANLESALRRQLIA